MTNFYSSVLKFFTGNVLLTGVNVVRDMSIAAAFGAAASIDHFFLASTLLVYLVTVSSSASRGTHVPVLQRQLGEPDGRYRDVARRLVALNIWSVLIGLAVLGILAYVGLQVAGLSHRDSTAKTARMLLYVLPMYGFSAFVEVCQGTLQTRNRILFPSMMRLGLPLGIIGGALIGQARFGVNALAIGGLVGSAAAGLGIVAVLWKEGLLSLGAPKLPTPVASVVRAGVIALTVSQAIAYVNPVVDLWMARLLGPGAVSRLGYASRLTVGLASLLVGSFAPVFLHRFSRLHATDNRVALRSLYSHFFAFAPWLGACMTLGTWLLSGVVAPLLYRRGSFSAADAHAVVTVIDAYALQFPFFLTCTVGFSLISALAKTQVFIRLNIVLLLSNLIADVTLIRYFGLEGLALATAIVYAVSLISMNTYLWREGTARPDTHSLSGAVIALCSLAVALIMVWYFDLKIMPGSGLSSYLTGMLLLAGLCAVGLVYNWPRISAYRIARAGIPVTS